MQAIGIKNKIDGIRFQFNLPWADILKVQTFSVVV